MEPLKIKVESYLWTGKHEVVCRTLTTNTKYNSLIRVCPPAKDTETNHEYIKMIGKTFMMDKYYLDNKFVFIAETWQELS